ncbi:MAG TPA: alpha-ketoglutarate-dependent dioxygenase AlkB [Leptolyngbyaceae cyanobacterium M65_K2018_010]|nr:alpha-ketoglutarate-dependent dioxygenase AlkB [Leptolyngbyaceae cyanobacterium M65_K2018_010]
MESDRLFHDLYTGIHWCQEHLQMFGKQIPAPRLTAWHGDVGKSYTYSRLTHHPQPWTAPLTLIRKRIEPIAQVQFNGVLLNLYRNGNDSMAWHSDDEPELGPNPIIGSVSLGGTRHFRFRHRYQKANPVGVNLTHGSLLIMGGSTQHFWQHQLAKTSRPVRPRINLTFRVIR